MCVRVLFCFFLFSLCVCLSFFVCVFLCVCLFIFFETVSQQMYVLYALISFPEKEESC